MSDNGLQRQLEKTWSSDEFNLNMEQMAKVAGICSTSTQALYSLLEHAEYLNDELEKTRMCLTHIYDTISQEEYQQASQLLSDYAEQLKQSTDSRILTLKSQLKHCKNPLQKLNLEREMNKLMREKGRR